MARPEAGLTSLEALGLAIRHELDARDVYRELADRCRDRLVQRRFALLAAEEERHHDLLQDRWRELSGGQELRLPPSQLPPGMATRAERGAHTLDEVLDLAIDEERRSRDFYLEAARETDDLSGQAMFRFLADMEYRHWMELAQERDLHARYPSYGGASPSPWRSEASLTSGERRTP
jgi:rubrerythrin